MDRRILKTKQAIQEAYFSLIMDESESRITIAEIARRANIDRKTFYLHYESVDNIIQEFCEERAKKLLFILEGNDFFDHPFDAKGLFRALNYLVEPDIQLYRYMARHSDYRFFWDQVENIIIQTIVEMYSEIVALSKKELNIYAHFFATGLLGTYMNWLKKENGISLDELGEIASEIAYYGIQKILPAE